MSLDPLPNRSDGEIMLKYPCLVLDHDDTVVQSEATVNHPFFLEFLAQHRPGMTISLHDYISECFRIGYGDMCRQRFGFTEEDLHLEYVGWKEHIQTHIPAPYPGIGRIIRRQKEAGGIVCVVSMSADSNIRRDYRTHFALEPDEIFGWDMEPENRKPSPWSLFEIMRKYDLKPEQLLVIDDTKAACPMARAAGVEIAFAGWGRRDFPKITEEMTGLCDYAFDSTQALERFLFDEE